MSLIRSTKHTVSDGFNVKTVDRERLNSAWGAKIEPLGFDRFKTCELMAELLHCSNMGLLNEPGSDEYVLQRDAEREKLIREGAFDPHRDDGSNIDYNDNTADFTSGSAPDSSSPEDLRSSEVHHPGEEDGFEDVGLSGVLVDHDKTETEKSANAPTEPQQTPESETESSAKSEHEQTAESAANPESSDRASPTPDLADQIGGIKLENELRNEIQVSTQTVQETSPVPALPEDVPPPLLVAKEEAAESTSAPTDQPQEGEPVQETEFADHSHEVSADEYIQLDTDGRPVVGDYLKIMFVDNKVVPTILVRLTLGGVKTTLLF
jgi:SIT4-associating protein SAP185/190